MSALPDCDWSNLVVLTLLIFLTVTLGITAGYQLLSGILFPDANQVRQRLADEFGQPGSMLPKSTLFKNLDQMSLDPALEDRSDPELNMPAASKPEKGMRERLATILMQAAIPISVTQLQAIAAVLGLLLGLVMTYVGGLVVGVLGAVLGVAAPLFFVQMKRKARQEKLIKQLPNAFDLMGRVLRAGHSVPQALQAVVDALDDPIAIEFASCQQQLNMGLSPELAYQEMARRWDILELRIFVMAMLIQRQAGGNLSEVLERIAGLVRSRLKLRNQVRTLTAEGRLQGWTLVGLPFVVFGVMMSINRKYAEILLEHHSLLLAGGVSLLIGILWIRKIVNFEI
jgi:tight adherence protein B